MFVRKKVKRSGTITVVVVNKSHGKFAEVKNFGVAKSESESDKLFQESQLWLHTHDGQQEFDFDDRCCKELEETTRVVENMDSVLINGTQLLISSTWKVIKRGSRKARRTAGFPEKNATFAVSKNKCKWHI